MAKKKVASKERVFTEIEILAIKQMASNGLSFKSMAKKLGECTPAEVENSALENNVKITKKVASEGAGLAAIKTRDGVNRGVVMTEGAAQRPVNKPNMNNMKHIFRINENG